MMWPADISAAPISFNELLFRRSLRCAVCHLIFLILVVLSSGALSWLPGGIKGTLWALISPSRWISFLLFLFSQAVFLAARWLILDPSYAPSASLGDIWILASSAFWRTLLGGKLDEASARKSSSSAIRLRASRDRIGFVLLCVLAGASSLHSWCSLATWNRTTSSVDLLNLGAVLGLAYAVRHLLQHDWVLSFPIVQRQFVYRLKLGLRPAATSALQLGVLLPLVLEVAAWARVLPGFHHSLVAAEGGSSASLAAAVGVFQVAVPIVFCLEMAVNISEVVFTERCSFAPPLGSVAAEDAPSQMLLAALTYNGRHAELVRHLAFLDLCQVAEGNANTWRRTALLEESGVTYQAVMRACIRNLEALVQQIKECLEGPRGGKDVTSQQLSDPVGLRFTVPAAHLWQLCQKHQLCSWSARAAASLTARTRVEDRYGVAQLSGSNAAVMSALLSCQLALEALIGKRAWDRWPQGHATWYLSRASSALQGPSAVIEGNPIVRGLVNSLASMAKKKVVQSPARALADVVKSSLYRIVTEFGEEMKQGGQKVLERDWLPSGEPLFGSRQVHLERLNWLLDFRD